MCCDYNWTIALVFAVLKLWLCRSYTWSLTGKFFLFINYLCAICSSLIPVHVVPCTLDNVKRLGLLRYHGQCDVARSTITFLAVWHMNNINCSNTEFWHYSLLYERQASLSNMSACLSYANAASRTYSTQLVARSSTWQYLFSPTKETWSHVKPWFILLNWLQFYY